MIVVALEVVEVSVGVPLHPSKSNSSSSSSSPSLGNEEDDDNGNEYVCDDNNGDGYSVLHVIKPLPRSISVCVRYLFVS